MDFLCSTNLAAASGNRLDRVLSSILTTFEGIVEVSNSHSPFLSPVPWVTLAPCK